MISPDEMLRRWDERRAAARAAIAADIDRQIENTFTGRSAHAEIRLESGSEAVKLAEAYVALGWRVKLAETQAAGIGMIRAVMEFTVSPAEKTEEKA